jgi:hypothetical protein
MEVIVESESDSQSIRIMAEYIWAHQSFLEIKDPIKPHLAPPLDFDPQSIRLKELTDNEYLTRYLPKTISAREAQVVGKLCPICYDLFDQSKILVRKLTCDHTFHQKCLDPWISQHKDKLACPYCRKSQFTSEDHF